MGWSLAVPRLARSSTRWKVACSGSSARQDCGEARALKANAEAKGALKCRLCRTPRYSLPVHMIQLTEPREITPYVWVHPDVCQGSNLCGTTTVSSDGTVWHGG